MDEERRREVGLFRYALIRDAADAGLSKAERGRLVRALADREHVGPDGRLVRVARSTLDEWIRFYRRAGLRRWSRGLGWSSRAHRPRCARRPFTSASLFVYMLGIWVAIDRRIYAIEGRCRPGPRERSPARRMPAEANAGLWAGSR